jgi:hypothetical protein
LFQDFTDDELKKLDKSLTSKEREKLKFKAQKAKQMGVIP